MQSTHENRWDEMTGDTQNSKQALQHWGALVGGGALAVIGVTRRSPVGWALAAAGGALAYSGLRSGNGVRQQSQHRPELGSNILVNASPEEAFRQWRDVEQAPRYMNFIESVQKIDERCSKWTATGPMGTKLQWTAEITDERPGEYIGWRSLPDRTWTYRVVSTLRRHRENAARLSNRHAIQACQPRVARCCFRFPGTAGKFLCASGYAAV